MFGALLKAIAGAGIKGATKGAGEYGVKSVLSAAPKMAARGITNNEAYTLGDFGDYLGKRYLNDTTNPANVRAINQLHMQARNAADTAGLDVIGGTNGDIQRRIAKYLQNRDANQGL
jgi:preprotein translocase subunit SecA